MKRPLLLILVVLVTAVTCAAQLSQTVRKSSKPSESGNPAVVIDERLSVLRKSASLYSDPVARLECGMTLNVYEEKDADGVLFYRIADYTARSGWIQADAIAGKFRKNDDQRVARLILGSNGFVQLQRASIFLDVFDDSPNRPWVLLLYGDLVEEQAGELSEQVTGNLDRTEMAAAQAPLHSFYLNHPLIDRYRKLGIRFLFNANTRILHYNGDSWFEITRKHPESEESIEARKRITTLTAKMKAVR